MASRAATVACIRVQDRPLRDALGGASGRDLYRMTCLTMMDAPGTQVTFTPDYVTGIVTLSDGSEQRFPSAVLDNLIVGGFIHHAVGGLVITAKGCAEAARDRDRSV